MADKRKKTALEAYSEAPDPEKVPMHLWDRVDMENYTKQQTVSGMRFLDDAEKSAKENKE